MEQRLVAKRVIGVLLSLFFVFGNASAQQKSSLTGKVIDKVTNEPLIGASILLKGTQYGAIADDNGNYKILNIKPGEYTVEISYIGYEKIVYTAIKIKEGENKVISAKLGESSLSFGQDVVIVGEKPLV